MLHSVYWPYIDVPHNPSKNDRSCADNPPICFGFVGCIDPGLVAAKVAGVPKEENENIDADVEGIGGDCRSFLKPSPLPTPRGIRKAAEGDTVDPIPTPPTGAGTPPRVSPSPSKSKLSTPNDCFGDEEDDEGGGIAWTLGSSESAEFGHTNPPHVAAWSTRLCVRRCSASLTDGTENALFRRLV